jgi:hypothetical protein
VSNPDSDFVMRKAVVGYWVSSTAFADRTDAGSDLTIRLTVSSEDQAGFGVFSEVQIDFVDLGEALPLGSGQLDDGPISGVNITLPAGEFSTYMAILQTANPAVLEVWFHQSAEGSIEYDITSARLTAGWKAATPRPGDGRPAPRPRPARIMRSRRPGEPARAHDASSGCEDLISTKYGVYHLVDEGVGADGWHYCGYEPGYGVFDDPDLVPYEPRIVEE